MAGMGVRRRKIIGHRRRVEDEGEDDGPEFMADLDDDSVTDGSIASDEHDAADDSDTSNIDDASPTSPNARKSLGNGNGNAKTGFRRRADAASPKGLAAKQGQTPIADAETMLNRLSLAEKDDKAEEMNFEDIKPAPPAKDAAPIVVSSSSAVQQQPRLPQQELKRREHEEYRRKREEDPTFVPNRGAFFLHDHRHAGPAANGFRPFPRGVRGRGRGAFGSHFAPISQMHGVPDPTTNGVWKHDMHEVVAEPQPPRQARYPQNNEGPANGNGFIPTAATSKTIINRAMSTEKHIGNATIRVFIPPMSSPKLFAGIALKQYTKLPDHRPPLRRDKPVRISLPYHSPPIMPRYIFPASDRSFIFIPRALRPNQQRSRGKGPRSILGSGAFSRGTSVWNGSVYGSIYSPSIALSRRSSIAPDIGREFMLSPTGSAISRPPLPLDTTRPVVRLPPLVQPPVATIPGPVKPSMSEKAAPAAETSLSELPQPQTHPLPQKPTFQENRPNAIPMHQPRPQKTVSIENIESPVQQTSSGPPPYQQAFHHQVPPNVPSSFTQDSHARNPSYQSQLSSTPLSQIPERAIHAAPFQPNTYAQPGFYGQPYPAPTMQAPQGFYYSQAYGTNMPPNANAPAFVPAAQQGQPVPYGQPAQTEAAPSQGPGGQAPSSQNLVAQEMNGMVYYYDPSQLPPMAGYPSFPATQPYAPPPGMVGMGAMMAPSPDAAFYYQQPAPGMVYYPQ